MKGPKLITKAGMVLGLVTMSFLSGCIIPEREGYHEGYWDRDHARYYHNHSWVACEHEDSHCR